ncbi:hypothetical protein [Bifidobacterium crudilactis]|uniref:hypothetical protein n=1 Tax=Bifidobacterium crudilactis TaxID=327277 RepID=UPI002356E53B|nr:hypothetical protein [Bifidobacterium crudilactis]MCI1218496.1 hypothetical protein [Bifidobacterium crudilactis]
MHTPIRRWTRSIRGFAHRHLITTAFGWLLAAIVLAIMLISSGIIPHPAGTPAPAPSTPRTPGTTATNRTSTPPASSWRNASKRQAEHDLNAYTTLMNERLGPDGETMRELLATAQTLPDSTYNQTDYAFTDQIKQITATPADSREDTDKQLRALGSAFERWQSVAWTVAKRELGHRIDQTLRATATGRTVIRADPHAFPDPCNAWARMLVHTDAPGGTRTAYATTTNAYRQWQKLEDQCTTQLTPIQAARLPQDQ